MSHVIHIHPLDVYERLKQGETLQIIDVREPGEVAFGKIPGAKNIPLGQIPMRMGVIDPNLETVMVCRSGNRSAMACEFLMSAGFSRVKNMLGGMNAWTWEVE